MINSQWLELPMSRTYFHGPKNVRAFESLLYFPHLLFSRCLGKVVFLACDICSVYPPVNPIQLLHHLSEITGVFSRNALGLID